ncbi:unnamed protein product [Diamesa tonsa]
MNKDKQDVTSSFQNNVCRTCAFTGEGKYYNFNDNFIHFQKVYIPFLEVIRVVLDIDIDKNDGNSIEICESCKNKLIDFYHYRKRCQLIQTIQGNMSSEDKNHIIQDHDLGIKCNFCFDTLFIVRCFISKQKISYIKIKKSDTGSGLLITSRNLEQESNDIPIDEETDWNEPHESDIQKFLNNEDSFDEPLLESPELNVNGMILSNIDLRNAANLQQMLELEEKTIMPSFNRNKVLTDAEKDLVCLAIIKCLLKNNPARLLKRQEFTILSRIIVDLFEENDKDKTFYYQYWDKLKTQFNLLRTAYNDAGLLNLKS